MISIDNPFEFSGEWLKGNLHTHTTRSDGSLTPQERVDAYEKMGYDFLALTDHGHTADLGALSPGRLTVLRGIETGSPHPTGGPGYHIVGLGLPEGFEMPPTTHAQAAVDTIDAAGGTSHMAVDLNSIHATSRIYWLKKTEPRGYSLWRLPDCGHLLSFFFDRHTLRTDTRNDLLVNDDAWMFGIGWSQDQIQPGQHLRVNEPVEDILSRLLVPDDTGFAQDAELL